MYLENFRHKAFVDELTNKHYIFRTFCHNLLHINYRVDQKKLGSQKYVYCSEGHKN